MKFARRTVFGAVASMAMLMLTLGSGSLLAQDQRNRAMPHDLDTDEYFLYQHTDPKQVVDYRSERIVRVCTPQSPHMIPLMVIADEREIEVAPGDCIRVEAKQVFLQPADELPNLAMIKVDVLTIDS